MNCSKDTKSIKITEDETNTGELPFFHGDDSCLIQNYMKKCNERDELIKKDLFWIYYKKKLERDEEAKKNMFCDFYKKEEGKAKKNMFCDFYINHNIQAKNNLYSVYYKKELIREQKAVKKLFHIYYKKGLKRDKKVIKKLIKKLKINYTTRVNPHFMSIYYNPELNGDILAIHISPHNMNYGEFNCTKCGCKWYATFDNITKANGRGCPGCAGKKATKTNNFSLSPGSIYYNPELNGGILADQIPCGSSKYVLFHCKKCDCKWYSTVRNIKNHSCPGCSIPCKKATKINNFSLSPGAKYYNPDFNDGILAKQISPCSNKYGLFHCKKCDCKWYSMFKDRSNNKCPGCSRKKATKTNNFSLSPGSIYYNPELNGGILADQIPPHSHKYGLFYCNTCNCKWYSLFLNITKGNQCPGCSIPCKKATKTNNFSLSPGAKYYNPDLNGSVLAEQIPPHSHKYGLFYCNTCNCKWYSKFYHLWSNGCPGCSGKKATENNNFSLVPYSKYYNPDLNDSVLAEQIPPHSMKGGLFYCKKCNCKWYATFDKHPDAGCPGCSIPCKKATKTNNFSLSSGAKYYNPVLNGGILAEQIPPCCNKYGLFYCKKCDCKWYTTFNNVTGRKSGCPRCNESKGEKRIREFLQKHNIRFIPQFKVKKHRYKYDFFLPDYNLLIEYDGIPHFKRCIFFHPDPDDFDKRKIQDIHKTQIASDENYLLLRVSYIHYEKITEILTDIIANPCTRIVTETNNEEILIIYNIHQEIINKDIFYLF